MQAASIQFESKCSPHKTISPNAPALAATSGQLGPHPADARPLGFAEADSRDDFFLSQVRWPPADALDIARGTRTCPDLFRMMPWCCGRTWLGLHAYCCKACNLLPVDLRKQPYPCSDRDFRRLVLCICCFATSLYGEDWVSALELAIPANIAFPPLRGGGGGARTWTYHGTVNQKNTRWK